MKITPVISYSDIFPGEVPKINILLSDISLNDILFCLSYISAQITNEKDNKIQFDLLRKFLESFPDEERASILNKLRPLFERNNDCIIFNMYTNMSFMDHALSMKDSLKHEGAITPIDETNFFKAYLIFSDNLFNSNEQLEDSNKLNKELSFQKLIWPMLKKQMQFAVTYEKDYLLFRLAVFFNYFKQDKYIEFLNNYNKKNETLNHWEIIFRLIETYSYRYKKDKKDNYIYIVHNSQEDTIFENLCIDVNLYGANWKPNFDLIKSKPLYKIDKNKYLVLNWDYLGNQLYLGTLFDFYHNSQISKSIVKLPDFLSIVGKEITEQIFFRKVIKYSFSMKHIKCEFDDNNKIDGLPDSYVRDNKNLYLFEMKDNLISSEIINNGDFEGIKRVLIDKFYISRNSKDSQIKGIKQLVKTMKYLVKSKFTFDDNLKINKTKIYPIIIYTDSFCSMPAVNDFLNDLYQGEIADLKLDLKLADLTLISLETIFKHIQNFRSRKVRLNDMIDDYHSHLQILKRKSISKYPSFDLYIRERKYNEFKSPNFVSDAFSCFDLKADFNQFGVPK